MYSVETDVEALDEIGALPAQALPFYAELITVLELAPWSGDPYNLQRPDANMRPHAEGLAIYLPPGPATAPSPAWSARWTSSAHALHQRTALILPHTNCRRPRTHHGCGAR